MVLCHVNEKMSWVHKNCHINEYSKLSKLIEIEKRGSHNTIPLTKFAKCMRGVYIPFNLISGGSMLQFVSYANEKIHCTNVCISEEKILYYVTKR